MSTTTVQNFRSNRTVPERRNRRSGAEALSGRHQPVASLYGDELNTGALAGEYCVLSTLAAGGCGTVYRVVHRVLGRTAALKVLHPDLACSPNMLARFVREACAMSKLQHPNIVDVYEFGQLLDGRPYYVMELLEGADLEAHLKLHGRVSPHEALEILEPVCAALRAAHDAGVVHRDLKASNVFLAQAGGRRAIKLLDFGIAKLLETPNEGGISSGSRRLGTPCAMAPEQFTGGAVDARTDVYALGVLLYQLVTGTLPFDPTDRDETARLHLEAPPPRASQRAPVSGAIDAVILRAMEKCPARRHGSVIHFLSEVSRAVRPAMTHPSWASVTIAPALGILIEADLQSYEELDDDILGRLTLALEEAERALTDEGFDVVLQTSSALLAALIAPEDPAAARAADDRRMAVARRIADSCGRSHVRILVHNDAVTIRSTGNRSEIIGGPLTRLSTWSGTATIVV
jgi:serine/threonine-protein kinase